MSEQKARWVTLKSGTHVFIDTDGVIKKGPNDFVGKNIAKLGYESEPTPVPKKPSKAYAEYLKEQDNVPHKAAFRYYQNEIRGHYVDAMIDGKKEQVFFSSAQGTSKNDLTKHLSEFPIKSELVPYIPKVIATGRALEPEKCEHEREDYKCFHVFKKRIKHKGQDYDMTVKVGERLDGTKVFRFHYFGQNKSTAQDFSISCARESQTRTEVAQYPTQEEILGYLVEEVKPIFAGQFAGLNRIKV